MIPYTVQREKIVQAYLKCEIDAMDCKACFVGNLLDNKTGWQHASWNYKSHFFHATNSFKFGLQLIESYGYTPEQIDQVEQSFLIEIGLTFNEEDNLFNGMNAALEVLRQIHLSKGDPTAIETPLQKRELCKS